MFTKYLIKELGIESLSRVTQNYGSCCEFQYYLEYISRKYQFDISYDGDYQYGRRDDVSFKKSLDGAYVDKHNALNILYVYKKTKAILDDTDYYEVKTLKFPNRRIYYSSSSNHMVVFVEKKMEMDDYCRYNFYNELFDYFNYLIPSNISYKDDPVIIEFKAAFANNDHERLNNWMLTNFPKPSDATTYEEKIKQFFHEANENRIRNLEEDIQAGMGRLKNYIEGYNSEYRRLNENRINLEALQKTTNDNPELIEAFNAMPNCKIIDVDLDEKELVFSIETLLTQFDVDKADTLMDMESNYVTWKSVTSKFTIDERKAIMKALFCDDPRYQIRIKQAMYITPTNDVYAKRNYRKFKNYLPNPHLDKFSLTK